MTFVSFATIVVLGVGVVVLGMYLLMIRQSARKANSAKFYMGLLSFPPGLLPRNASRNDQETQAA